MKFGHRVRSLLALLLFASISVGVPIADAIWYHDDPGHGARPHVESADGSACHAERCALGAPVAPAPLAAQLSAPPRFEDAPRRQGEVNRADTYRDRTPHHAHGSRAPPA